MTSNELTFELLAELAGASVRLFVRGIQLGVDAPLGTLTPERVERIRQNKAALIEAVELAGPCDRCGSFEFVDAPIHDGKSVRRDCRWCRRTQGFPIWTPEAER